MNVDNLWRAEMMGSFEESVEERYIRKLGEEYHRRTEAFDQTVCEFRNERGIAIPIDRHERRACNANADRIESELLGRARDEGISISRAELRRAIQDAAPC